MTKIRLFPTKARWSKYKWFSKFGIITGYATIAALLIAIYQIVFTNSVNKNDLVPLAKSDELEDIKQQLYQISNELKINISQVDTAGYPGYSISLMVVIKKNLENRNAFIFDRGNFLDKERISLYLNEVNDLCFRIIDSFGEIHSIAVQESHDGFRLERLLFITCEYGEINNNSFQRILINGKEIEKLSFSKNFKLSNKIRIEGSTLGADLSGNNCSNLLAAIHLMAHKTFTRIQIAKVEERTRHFIENSNLPLMKVGCGNYLRMG